jgi:wobble nucleotide-excising tRNase
MLRRLDIRNQYRSLSKGFWPEDLPFGRRTVIYGHNASGKSTLSELLLEIASGQAPTDVIWEDERQQSHNIASMRGGPSPSMAVFTKKWVQRNLSEFLDGRSASAIVTLGRDAIDAREEEETLDRDISDLREVAQAAEKKARDLNRKVDELARSVQDAITSQLREFDYQRFTKNRYSLPKVKEELAKYKGAFPDENEHANSLKRLGEGVASRLAEVDSPPTTIADAIGGLAALLDETPSRVALASLEGHADRQAWVERGSQLHSSLDECLFCAGPLTEERRRQLAQHFDESWLSLRRRAVELLREVERERANLASWLEHLPAADALVSDVRAAYSSHVDLITEEVAQRTSVLEKIEAAVKDKIDDPSSTPAPPDMSIIEEPLSTTVLSQAVVEHNQQVDAHAEVVERHVNVVLEHLVGSKSERFRDLQEQLANAAEQSKASNDAAALAQRKLDRLRQQKFSSSEMAETLTEDLARVYGRDHLSVAVTEDGKSYSCRRGSAPATHLSEGERTSLSLPYFLRKLEEETDSTNPLERVVVIDDPSSSLDREALFATHQWLIDTLDGFGQFIVLTHDFGLLRLFIKSQNNAWGKSMKLIREGNVDETAFPRVSFLEMFAVTSDGERQTRVGALPKLLLKSTSEYAYLFAMVMAGIADSENHERLFLLPNATRRVLEVFASYKAPHLSHFDQRLKCLMDETSGDPYRDVYDFCNRYSHGEGSESVDVLDARVVHRQIQRCMQFLRSVDADHFSRMCKATSVDESVLP